MNNVIPFPTEQVRLRAEDSRIALRLAIAMRIDWWHKCTVYGKRIGGIKGRKCVHCGKSCG